MSESLMGCIPVEHGRAIDHDGAVRRLPSIVPTLANARLDTRAILDVHSEDIKESGRKAAEEADNG